MTLTKEDLIALSNLMDGKLKVISDKIEAGMGRIESRLDSLEARMDSLEARMDSLEARMDSLEARMNSLEARVEELEQDVRRIKYMLNKDIIPRLQIIEECYLSTFERYKEKNERFDVLEADVTVLKHVVKEHSVILEKIS